MKRYVKVKYASDDCGYCVCLDDSIKVGDFVVCGTVPILAIGQIEECVISPAYEVNKTVICKIDLESWAKSIGANDVYAEVNNGGVSVQPIWNKDSKSEYKYNDNMHILPEADLRITEGQLADGLKARINARINETGISYTSTYTSTYATIGSGYGYSGISELTTDATSPYRYINVASSSSGRVYVNI